MLGLERLLQSNYHPASEITPSATYFPIRPAHSTRWPLLLCPFPASIFLHLPIDFLLQTFRFRRLSQNLLGETHLTELTPLQIQNYLYEKMHQGLSPNTVIKHYVMLNTALQLAVRLEIIARSPTERVLPPKKKEIRINFYSPEQLQQLFAAVENTMLELPVKLAAYLGLRRSEICGLRWENINLEAGLLSIQEARTEIGGVVVQKAPKTRKSIRRLGIAGLQDLKRILQRAWERRRSNDPKEWVVLRPDGTPPKPDQLTQNLLMVVRKNGLPRISLHGLRHSFASVANSQGVPMFDISRTLGHSSMSVTSNIYTHLFDETETHALNVVAKAIEGAE